MFPMKHALKRCDADRIPAYLENSNPRNTPFYERFGFEPLGVIKAGSIPEIVPMFEKAALEVRRRSASRRLAILQEIVKVVDPTHSGFLRYE
jgi:hypothetical protein